VALRAGAVNPPLLARADVHWTFPFRPVLLADVLGELHARAIGHLVEALLERQVAAPFHRVAEGASGNVSGQALVDGAVVKKNKF
jgi:hypothetical protein